PRKTMNSERQRRECEFRLLRYVPDAVRNEYVHIGVILREPATEDQPARTEVMFTHDWRRVRCLDPDADTALLEGMESELRRRLADHGLDKEPAGKLMRILEESLSLNVQMTETKAREWVPRLSGRAAIQARMRAEFERAGVWDLLRKRIAASEYTRPGDPL